MDWKSPKRGRSDRTVLGEAVRRAVRAEAERNAALARAEAAEAERLKWAIALQGMTPGGSEYQTPEACAELVRRRREDEHGRVLRFAKRAKAAEARVAEAERLLRDCRAAIEPLPSDALGEGYAGADEYSLRDDLVDRVAAFLAAAPESEAP